MSPIRIWKFVIIPFMGYLFLRLLRITLRLKVLNDKKVNAYLNEGGKIIMAFWHGRQLFMPFAYKGNDMHILISRHGDGEMVAEAMRYFGFKSVRGSSSKGAVSSLRQMITLGRKGHDLAITPDGPRGPKNIVQMGVIEIAKMTGLPIYPITFSALKKNTCRHGMNS